MDKTFVISIHPACTMVWERGQIEPPADELFSSAAAVAAERIKKTDRQFFRTLVQKKIPFRVSASANGCGQLMPHEILFPAALLNAPKKNVQERILMLAGVLERLWFHFCNPELHITEARRHSLSFLHAHPDILSATMRQLQAHKGQFDEPDWLETLKQADTLLALDEFWRWLAMTDHILAIFLAAKGSHQRLRAKIKAVLTEAVSHLTASSPLQMNPAEKLLFSFKHLFQDENGVVIVYELAGGLYKAFRVCSPQTIDAMSAHSACQSILYRNIRTDIFVDHGHWIRPWIERLKLYQKQPELQQLQQQLMSDNLEQVNAAIAALRTRLRKKQLPEESLRLLYSALYYWHHPDKNVCRALTLKVCAMLEDILTERPASFPPSRINRTLLRTEPKVISIDIPKPKTIRKDQIQARILWSVNGRRKKPILMTPSTDRISAAAVRFEATLPIRNGWCHYAVQVSYNGGNTWQWEEFHELASGLIKSMPDERGQRVLSFYADTLNLKLNSDLTPQQDERGLYVYGTFDDIANQLEEFKKEGYTRIYPLGALELGWAGEAGPDPSVFSVLDGKTIRRDLGGLEALLRLREKADQLGMKILLCMLSHFSRANNSYAYHFPTYIVNNKGVLTRRAGWDGEWSEWLDSFMVNMRDLDNVEALAQIGIELTRLGFGLRIDVGHGFDTVFPIDPRTVGAARLFGEVTRDGFEQIDLRKTETPNIALLYICYKIQKTVPNALLVYSEQWHGNETRMLKSCTIPYNALIKNLESIRGGQPTDAPLGLNDNLRYLDKIYRALGGQTLSLFNSHDEESPASNYQNMIWPAAAFLVFSAYGPIMYHISRLPGPECGSMAERFDIAYTECWKHWVNNRFRHPWHEEAKTRQQILAKYPILSGFGKYLRGLYQFADEHAAFTKGRALPIQTGNGRIAAFYRIYRDQTYICVFNFPNPFHEGQQAVARSFNFLLDLPELKNDGVYEIAERYNNAEGKTRRGWREFWSGQELKRLGFGGVLEPVSSHVFELTEKTEQADTEQLILDSFQRYSRYGRQHRIENAYVAQQFLQATHPQRETFDQFESLFYLLSDWIYKKNQIGYTQLAGLLAEISDTDSDRRAKIYQYLLRIAVDEKQRGLPWLRRWAADILNGMNLGTIALVSPESQYSGNAGGVGIYTTDIADMLSELGFHVVVITPLYESSRDRIIKTYNPRYDGHSFAVQFPEFDERAQSIHRNTPVDIVNILRANLLRSRGGKRWRVEVLYLENAKYMDAPYGGVTCEDKLRRARILSQGALEALRAYNYYPSIIQTNEWPTWLVSAYLKRWPEFFADPHFAQTRVGSMMHNPHPSYSIVMDEANPFKRYYYSLVIGLDAVGNADICFNPDSVGGRRIEMTYIMLKTSDYIGTVSRAMKARILAEPNVFGYAHLFAQMEAQGRFFGRRNGFNMAARQRLWFKTKHSILEVYDKAARKRLFSKYTHAKKLAKLALQNDPAIRLKPDDAQTHHVIFAMLHRICKQKGFELLVDWKVYEDRGRRYVVYEPWKMSGPTVLEYFLSRDSRIQFVICGRVEDSFDGRRYDMHLRRIAHLPDFAGRFAYYPEGSLSPTLYRNVYVGSQYFVMPSGGEVGEPCGISQQEAHAGGTPVIAHHQDGLIRTVCDRDFGDTENPPNGIKFSGFNGEALLDALLDAVEIYFYSRRLRYVDKNGRPQKCRYIELSYNAFCTDHRWLRLLRDYVQMYRLMANVDQPPHIDAARLIVEMIDAKDDDLADVILQQGLKISQAADVLVAALACPVQSVAKTVETILIRLYRLLKDDREFNLIERLTDAMRSRDAALADAAKAILAALRPALPAANAQNSEQILEIA